MAKCEYCDQIERKVTEKAKSRRQKSFLIFEKNEKSFLTVLKCLHPPLMSLHFAHSHTFQVKPRHKDEIYSLFYFQHPPIFHHIFPKCFFPSHFHDVAKRENLTLSFFMISQFTGLSEGSYVFLGY